MWILEFSGFTDHFPGKDFERQLASLCDIGMINARETVEFIKSGGTFQMPIEPERIGGLAVLLVESGIKEIRFIQVP